jgi:hypothetical protein
VFGQMQSAKAAGYVFLVRPLSAESGFVCKAWALASARFGSCAGRWITDGREGGRRTMEGWCAGEVQREDLSLKCQRLSQTGVAAPRCQWSAWVPTGPSLSEPSRGLPGGEATHVCSGLLGRLSPEARRLELVRNGRLGRRGREDAVW